MYTIFLTEINTDSGSYYVPNTLGFCTIILIILLILLGIFYFTGKKATKNYNSKKLAFSSLAISLSTVCSYISIIKMPMGGSITLFSMFFIALIGYWFGLRTGLLSAIAFGCLQLCLNPYIIHPIQLIMDYILAYGALGLSGIFYGKNNGLTTGYITGVLGRFVFSFLSGVVFFGSCAADYNMGVFLYSACYNGLYLFGEMLLTLILLAIPSFKRALKVVENQIT